MKKMKNNMMKWTALLSVLMLTACQQAEDLESSVNSRWASLIEEDYEKAYSYFSPGHRDTETLEAFKLRMLTAQINVRWSAAKFTGSTCEDEVVCEAVVKLDYNYTFTKRSLGGMEVQTDVKENWIKIEDKWYLVPKTE